MAYKDGEKFTVVNSHGSEIEFTVGEIRKLRSGHTSSSCGRVPKRLPGYQVRVLGPSTDANQGAGCQRTVVDFLDGTKWPYPTLDLLTYEESIQGEPRVAFHTETNSFGPE